MFMRRQQISECDELTNELTIRRKNIFERHFSRGRTGRIEPLHVEPDTVFKAHRPFLSESQDCSRSYRLRVCSKSSKAFYSIQSLRCGDPFAENSLQRSLILKLSKYKHTF